MDIVYLTDAKLFIYNRKQGVDIMSENTVITIERQYASGGIEIGGILANKLNIPVYGREIIEMAADRSGIPKEYLESTQENVSHSFLYRLSLAAKTGSMDVDKTATKADILYNEVYKVVTELSQKESCIIVGQCADYILKDHKKTFKVFVHANMEDRIKRAIENYGISEQYADYIIRKNDNRREAFYNANTMHTWGVKENYHICLNSSLFSVKSCADIIIDAMKYMKTE